MSNTIVLLSAVFICYELWTKWWFWQTYFSYRDILRADLIYKQGFQSSHLVLGLILMTMSLLMWFYGKCWHPLCGHRAIIWHSETSAFKPVSWSEEALQDSTWSAARGEGLPRAAGSDFRAASSCLLLLPSVGPLCASRSSQVNIQVLGMPANVDHWVGVVYSVL